MCRASAFIYCSAALALVTLGGGAHAQTKKPPEAARLAPSVALTGTCSKLIIAGGSSSRCDGRILNSNLDGRSSFYFATTGGGAIVFSGLSHRNVKVGPHDTIVQPIDALVVIVTKEVKPTRIDAVGECRFRQYQAGRALPVGCTAQTQDGLYEAMFESDSRAPEVIR